MSILLTAMTPQTGIAVQTRINQGTRTLQAVATATGAVTATIVIEVSLDNVNFMAASTITLSDINTAQDGVVLTAAWDYMRARLSAISGVGASVIVLMGA